MASPTVTQLRKRLAQRFSDHWDGQLTDAEASTTWNLPERKERSNYFQNGWIRTDVDDDVEEFPITASATTDPHITVAFAPSASIAAGTVYEIHRRFSAEMYTSMLMDAIWDAQGEAVLHNLDYQTLTWVLDTYEYAVPTNFRYITEVQLLDSASEPVAVFGGRSKTPLNTLRILPGVPRKLEFPRWFSSTVGDTIRILGQGSQLADDEGLDPDSGIVQVDASFVLYAAELALRRIQAGVRSPVGDAARQQIPRLEGLVEVKRAGLSTRNRAAPNAMQVY